MKTYRYRGFDRDETPIEGTVRALDEQDAMEKVRTLCPVPVKLSPAWEVDLKSLLSSDVSQLLSGGRIPAKKLALLCSQLAICLQAGMPLVVCLTHTAQNQTDPPIRQLLEGVAEDVRAGASLADAFEQQKSPLPPVFLQTVRAGESSASLASSFQQLAHYYDRQAAVSSAVGSAMIYPMMLILTAIAVIVIIMVYAVPVFEESFSRMGNALPTATAILIGISRFLSENALLLAVLTVITVLSLLFLVRTPRGSLIAANVLLTFPGIGNVNRMQGAAMFSTTLSSMLSAGLTLPDALAVTADTLENPLLAQELRQAAQGLRDGQTLAQGLGESAHFPKLLTELTAVGEETGTLTQTLTLAADYYRTEVETAVKRALGILEPCIILVLASMVVFILLAVYLPMFQMYTVP